MTAFLDFWSLRYSAGGHPLTRLISQRLGAVIAFASMHAGLSPSAVTLCGLVWFLLSCVFYALIPAGWNSAFACLVLLQIGYAIDCADGQLARATGQTSPFGAWLDLACDHARNIMLCLTLAYRLHHSPDVAEWGANAAATILLVGMTAQLHAVTFLRQFPQQAATSAQKTKSRLAVTTLVDTATFLLMLAVLRDHPHLLLAYAVLAGFIYLGLGVLRPARQLGKDSSSR